MAVGGVGVPLARLRGGGVVHSGLTGDEILSVHAYHDETEEWVVPRSNSFFR
jgi:hypothetical protein